MLSLMEADSVKVEIKKILVKIVMKDCPRMFNVELGVG